MSERRKNHRENGFTLIELLITLAVLSFGLLGLAGLQAQMIRSNSYNRDLTIATSIGTEMIEREKAKVAGGTNKSETFVYDDDPDLSITSKGEMYNKRFTVERIVDFKNSFNPDVNFEHVEIKVKWNNVSKNGETHELTFVTDMVR